MLEGARAHRSDVVRLIGMCLFAQVSALEPKRARKSVSETFSIIADFGMLVHTESTGSAVFLLLGSRADVSQVSTFTPTSYKEREQIVKSIEKPMHCDCRNTSVRFLNSIVVHISS